MLNTVITSPFRFVLIYFGIGIVAMNYGLANTASLLFLIMLVLQATRFYRNTRHRPHLRTGMLVIRRVEWLLVFYIAIITGIYQSGLVNTALTALLIMTGIWAYKFWVEK